jgi:hypothetical protein
MSEYDKELESDSKEVDEAGKKLRELNRSGNPRTDAEDQASSVDERPQSDGIQ